jgi:sugar transferase (PEP-CTERM/EpsH1 system associated)
VAGLLFLTQRIPYPPSKGEKIRSWNILRYLAQHYDIHLGCLVDDEDDHQYEPVVAAACASSHFARLDRARAKITCLSGLLTGEPLSVTFYHNAGLARWVKHTIETVQPDVIFVNSSNMAPYVLDQLQRARVRVCDLVDVDSEKWHAYSRAGRLPMSWVYGREWRKTAALEARIVHDFDFSVFVSPEEAGLMTRLLPMQSQKIRAISNGVNHDYFDPRHHFAAPFPTNRANYVFTGTMDYPPNVDAVRWYAEAIFPLIRQRLPDAQFYVVGMNPSPAVLALAGLPGVNIVGRVDDVRPFLANATAGVAPLRIARGIQNKVLESMAMARPTVVTRDALTGIAAEPGRDVLLADDAAGFADACIAVHVSGASEIGRAARAFVVDHFTWAETLRGFDDLLDLVHPT